jgi:DNA transformation protein and related proteins
MPAPPDDFTVFVLEQLSAIPDLTAMRMFGGVGIKSDGAMFAIIMRGMLYFATDDASRPRYEALGSRCFSYQTRARIVHTKFFEVPADLLEDRDQLRLFARDAIGVARKTAAARKPRKRANSARS